MHAYPSALGHASAASQHCSCSGLRMLWLGMLRPGCTLAICCVTVMPCISGNIALCVLCQLHPALHRLTRTESCPTSQAAGARGVQHQPQLGLRLHLRLLLVDLLPQLPGLVWCAPSKPRSLSADRDYWSSRLYISQLQKGWHSIWHALACPAIEGIWMWHGLPCAGCQVLLSTLSAAWNSHPAPVSQQAVAVYCREQVARI